MIARTGKAQVLGNRSMLDSFWQVLTEAQTLHDLGYVLESQMNQILSLS